MWLDLRSIVLLFALAQAVVFGILLLRRAWVRSRLSDLWLAIFLWALAATLSEHIAGWLGWYEDQRLTFFPFGGNFLYPPLAFFYIRSVTRASDKEFDSRWLHFFPAALYFVIHLVVWALPVPEKLSLLNNWNSRGFFFAEGAFELAILTGYTLASAREYWFYKRMLPEAFSNLPEVPVRWLQYFLLILAGICLVEWGFALTQLFYPLGYDKLYWDYFLRAILVYYLSVAGFLQRSDQSVPVVRGRPAPPLTPRNDLTQPHIDRLIAFVEGEKPYLHAELSLAQLAERMAMSPATISQTLNEGLGKNFNDFINGYRVSEVCQRLKAGEHLSKTLLGVALDSGFNSKATFNRVFKKTTGLTPKEWLERHSGSSQVV